MEYPRDIMTPEQAADYLQINRETVYRYIRSGKLVASRLGKAYRIQRRSIDSLMAKTQTAPAIAVREYTAEQVAGFLEEDALTPDELEVMRRFLRSAEEARARSV